jgi:16S rRNA (cytidine1402-2'-O)-methyltransferase
MTTLWWEDGGVLILAGTPIGRVEDASPRLAAALASAEVIAAEDTRRLRRLASDLNIDLSARIVSYFEGNERERTPELLEALREGLRVVLVTDAGMPSVSDPGYRIVAAAIAEDLPLTAIPGPSAVVTALAVSGLPVDRFSFEGFAPRKAGERARMFGALASEQRTMVFFESPHRIGATLAAMSQAFGPSRPAAVCRELTKTYEEVARGTLAELIAWADSKEIKGEITVVVAGATEAARELDASALADLVAGAEATGLSRKDAIARVAAETGARKRDVYAAAHA